jgi:predicted flap endonuclease-1-like 5' DNA nuclease
MATNLLWFVMAGFLLGFATSTLWEWFYFRKERLKLTDRRIRELEAKLRDATAETDSSSFTTASTTSPIPTVASVTGTSPRTTAWGDTSYRSPGVFLESEEYEADLGEAPATPPVVPTVNRVTTPSSSAAPSSAPLTSTAPSSTVPPASLGPTAHVTPPTPVTSSPPDSTFAPRPDHPSPADALRAKRAGGPRTRQELLAALRRNSEAMQRGEFPRPEAISSSDSQPAQSRPNTFVASKQPAEQASENHNAPPQPVDTPTPAPVLSPARLRWINNPELTQRTKEYPDDLSKIKGIGDVYKQRLYRAGIYTWRQIAEADTETLRRATNAYPSSNVEEWLVQAEKLMEKHGRKDAVYNGPRPDDMTKILGIGPVSASVLYRAGICTYEQLATTPIAELEALFPIAVAGDQPDFAQWVARAAELADEKHSNA